jgi:hypothetical protein
MIAGGRPAHNLGPGAARTQMGMNYGRAMDARVALQRGSTPFSTTDRRVFGLSERCRRRRATRDIARECCCAQRLSRHYGLNERAAIRDA